MVDHERHGGGRRRLGGAPVPFGLVRAAGRARVRQPHLDSDDPVAVTLDALDTPAHRRQLDQVELSGDGRIAAEPGEGQPRARDVEESEQARPAALGQEHAEPREGGATGAPGVDRGRDAAAETVVVDVDAEGRHPVIAVDVQVDQPRHDDLPRRVVDPLGGARVERGREGRDAAAGQRQVREAVDP